ncbi:hypothetical protein GUJ93_ZPchr0007g4692 [Zizania palustris]|uniref:Uncharacterized protein n=1 Tax=Zizania palustris TaxID=103762 RepID=A0A8J5TH97_ZIZPA|nr:hypothetical protein GUJ93_ZPchr0007g4692 [Zizania palustris]
MASTFASIQLPPPILGPPATARNGCAGRRLRMAVACCCKHNQPNIGQQTRVSRRDVLSNMSSAFIATLLVAAGPAEARTSRQENKRKVREKMQKLREKALGTRPRW